MSDNQSRPDRVIGILAFLLVGVFAGVVLVLYSPWGNPAPVAEAISAPAQAVLETLDEGEFPLIEMQLKSGPVIIRMRADLAPNHVAQIVTLTNEGFYDGIVFHRVIEGFMAQTGDPTGTGTGGSELADIAAEFSDQPFVRGTVGMARSADPDSANSQFFIVYEDASFLNGQYTIVGEVIEGMENVDAIKQGDANANGLVSDPDAIISMRVISQK